MQSLFGTSLASHFEPHRASPAGLLGCFAPSGFALAFSVASLPQALLLCSTQVGSSSAMNLRLSVNHLEIGLIKISASVWLEFGSLTDPQTHTQTSMKI